MRCREFTAPASPPLSSMRAVGTAACSVAGAEKPSDVDVKHNVITNGYFSALHIPLLAGRDFGPQDTATSQKVAIISERMARTMFPRAIHRPALFSRRTKTEPKSSAS